MKGKSPDEIVDAKNTSSAQGASRQRIIRMILWREHLQMGTVPRTTQTRHSEAITMVATSAQPSRRIDGPTMGASGNRRRLDRPMLSWEKRQKVETPKNNTRHDAVEGQFDDAEEVNHSTESVLSNITSPRDHSKRHQCSPGQSAHQTAPHSARQLLQELRMQSETSRHSSTSGGCYSPSAIQQRQALASLSHHQSLRLPPSVKNGANNHSHATAHPSTSVLHRLRNTPTCTTTHIIRMNSQGVQALPEDLALSRMKSTLVGSNHRTNVQPGLETAGLESTSLPSHRDVSKSQIPMDSLFNETTQDAGMQVPNCVTNNIMLNRTDMSGLSTLVRLPFEQQNSAASHSRQPKSPGRSQISKSNHTYSTSDRNCQHAPNEKEVSEEQKYLELQRLLSHFIRPMCKESTPHPTRLQELLDRIEELNPLILPALIHPEPLEQAKVSAFIPLRMKVAKRLQSAFQCDFDKSVRAKKVLMDRYGELPRYLW